MSKKRSVLISTCGFYTTKGNYDSVIPMFNHLLGEGNYETIFCSQGELFRVPELSKRTNEYLGFVKKAGAEFVNGSISDDTKNQLNTLLFPKETFEAMADASWGIDKETGEKMDESLIFTKQMASLYNKNSYNGKDIILEMKYTDIGKTYQIILKKDSYEVLSDNLKTYTTQIETPYTVWTDIASGKISGQEALMQKMYKVKGNFDLMIHWDDYFGETGGNTENNANTAISPNTISKIASSSTNMLIMLLPWIVFWVATSINSFTGSLISMIACAGVSLLFYRNKKTIYDIISSAAVIIFSAMVIYLNNADIILPISYLCFGLMWVISCFTKIPLSAHYSANDYSGEKAFKNPLFIKTNYILTMMWGILYVITAIMTFFIMKSDFSSYLGIINNILPILMGIFTAWFQKWYPAKVARG